MTKVTAIAAALFAVSTLGANAETRALATPAPNATDLQIYAQCSAISLQRALSFDEGAACGRAFMRIKLAFVPDIGLAEFEQLDAGQKAAVNRLGYTRFRTWSETTALKASALHN